LFFFAGVAKGYIGYADSWECVSVMKALVLTAGRGKRLRPLTANRSKSMLMIAGRPVLQYIIDSLKANGIKDIIIVLGHGREQIVDHFQHGGDQEVQIGYVLQHEQKGVEHAMLTAAPELEDEDEFLLVNGDVLVEDEMVSRTLNNHENMNADVTMLVTLVSNPAQFGTVKMGRNGRVEKLVEKGGPERYVSNYAVAGVSVFTSEIFDMLREHETMEKAIGEMIKNERRIVSTVWEKEWAEFTWPWDILKANRIVMDRKLKGRGSFIAESVEVGKNVVIEGPVYIDEDAIIRPGTTLRGPLYIGKRVHIGNNSLIRDYSCLCDDVHIGYSVEIRNSMIFEKVNVGRMTYVADSMVGTNSCIEAGAQLWNWRPGSEPFFFENGDEKIEVPLSKIGGIIGDNVVIGVNASLYPAVKIGEESMISPGCVIDRNIPPRKNVSVKQKLIVSDREEEPC
jgi:bifunctional UDP-N-acetylglucosamine pyrophosphorylase/glucosamine-1-phosphate N-acetyltransferase